MLETLNAKQRLAVTTTEGPVLVIAGPGSGKTKTLTHRMVYLMQEKKVAPEHILAVTFTNKAAGEMRARVAAMLKTSAVTGFGVQAFTPRFLPLIGTFHSFCMQILRLEAPQVGLKSDFVIYDADEQLAIIKRAMKELNLPTEQFNPRAVQGAISDAKNQLKNAERFAGMADGFFAENAARVYALYEKRLQEAGAVDFDDLIMQATLLFEGNRRVLEKYQDRFRFVMVDEYQDTNFAQYRLMDLLSHKHRNLCVVGDDWQSIYRWRGADIQNILDFEKNYPEAQTILLEQNYRSTQNILDAAYSIIAKNRNRKEKKLWTEAGEGRPITVYEAADEKGEAEFVVSEIAKLTAGGEIKLGDIAILYRTNAQSRALEETFLRFSLPYKIVGGIKFYMRREIKDVLAYLRFVLNPADLASLERIINVPARRIGKATLEKVAGEMRARQTDFVDLVSGYEGKALKADKLKALGDLAAIVVDLKQALARETTADFLVQMLERIDYERYIKDGTEEGESRWENVRELFSALEHFKNLPAAEGVRAFLDEVALVSDMDELDDRAESVTMMTLHSSKGLEFDTVFVLGLEEGVLPHSRSLQDESEMEEERRLCYVGMTRAKRNLYLTYARTRRLFGAVQANAASRFLGDIPEHLLDRQTQGYSFLDDFYEEKYLDY